MSSLRTEISQCIRLLRWTRAAVNCFARLRVFSANLGRIRQHIFKWIQHTGLRHSEPRFAAVISSSGKPVSAKQNFSPLRPRGRAILCQLLPFVLFFVLVFLPRSAQGDNLEESTRLLARKVWASIHGSSVKLEFRNLSSLRSAEFASLSAAFQEELQRRGVKILAADAAASLVVSITQNPTEYIGVVQIQRKEIIETVMDTIGLVKGPGVPEPQFSLVLHKELLFSSDGPILDVVLDADEKHAYALGVQEHKFVRMESRAVDADGVRASSHSSIAGARWARVYPSGRRFAEGVFSGRVLPRFHSERRRMELRKICRPDACAYGPF